MANNSHLTRFCYSRSDDELGVRSTGRTSAFGSDQVRVFMRGQRQMNLSPEERELFVEAGYHIARVMWQNLSGSDPTYEAVMWDQAESVYEQGCAIMAELGVFDAESSSSYRFSMPLGDVRDHLQELSPRTSYSLDQIIGKFLWATAGYQGDISDEKEPFEVPGYLQTAMWAFVKLGYATREPKGFAWTEKITPIMIAESLWSSNGESWTTLDKQSAHELTERIWAAMPVWRRHLLARWIVGKDEADLFTYIFRRWDGKHLRMFEKPKDKFETLPSGYRVVARVVGQRLIAIRRGHPF